MTSSGACGAVACGLALALGVAATSDAGPAGSPAPPNVLWIKVEDISPAVGAFGDACAPTPNLAASYPLLARYLRSEDRLWETLLAATVVRDLGEEARPLLADIRAARERHAGDADGRYRNWMFSMFIGFALDQALANLGAGPAS
jgi:hypothetical protein